MKQKGNKENPYFNRKQYHRKIRHCVDKKSKIKNKCYHLEAYTVISIHGRQDKEQPTHNKTTDHVPLQSSSKSYISTSKNKQIENNNERRFKSSKYSYRESHADATIANAKSKAEEVVADETLAARACPTKSNRVIKQP